MKRKKLTVFVLGLMLIFVGVLTGCQLDTTIIGTDHQSQGYYKVTLFYNGGTSNGSYFHDRFVPKNSRFPYPGGSGSPINSPTRTAHTLDGWYLLNADYFESRPVERTITVVDENGVKREQKLYYENGDVVIDTQYYIEGFDYVNGQKTISASTLEDPDQDVIIRDWNFEIDRVKGDIVLVPLWKSAREYVFIGDDETKLLDPDDDYFLSRNSGGEYEFTRSMRPDGSIKKPDTGIAAKQVPIPTSMQVEGLYLDDRFVNEVPFDENGLYYPPETYNEDGSIKRFPIYVKYIDQALKIVNTASDFSVDSNGAAILEDGMGLYLKNNINLGGKELNFRNRSFSQYIYGNGYTISNFVVNVTQSQNPSIGTYGGIFDTVDNATMSNITFDRFTINFKRNSGAQYLTTNEIIVNSLAVDLSNVTLVNVKISNMTLVDQPSLTFETFIFTGDNLSDSVRPDGTIFPSGAKSQLYSYKIENESVWETRKGVTFGQTGINFGLTSDRIINSVGENIKTEDWVPDFERIVTSSNYYALPEYGNLWVGDGMYTFYGWFDDSGYQYGSRYIIPAAGEEITCYPMFCKVQ